MTIFRHVVVFLESRFITVFHLCLQIVFLSFFIIVVIFGRGFNMIKEYMISHIMVT